MYLSSVLFVLNVATSFPTSTKPAFAPNLYFKKACLKQSSARPLHGARLADRLVMKMNRGHANVLKDFLTQRSLQTYLHNLKEVGDHPNFNYIEDFMEHQGVCNLHGYGALKVGWHEYISKLYRQADSEYKMKRMLYRGGTSGNPYIQEQFMEISTMIRPRKAAIAIMELREHIAGEWQKDLQLVARENAEHWRHHLAKVQHNGTDPELHKQHRLLITTDDDSALRIDNYDLLIKFCTHIACEQVMEELAANPKDEHSAIWLKEYMQNRGTRSFGTVQTRRVGWNFLNDILNEPPRVISGTGRDADTLCLIDPLDMGARIMAQRQNVAECWLEVLHEVKDDNLSIHRKFMEDCMNTVLTDFWKNN